MALGQGRRFGPPVVHLDVDVIVIVAGPGGSIAVVPQPLQVGRQAAGPRAARQEIAAVLEHRLLQGGIDCALACRRPGGRRSAWPAWRHRTAPSRRIRGPASGARSSRCALAQGLERLAFGGGQLLGNHRRPARPRQTGLGTTGHNPCGHRPAASGCRRRRTRSSRLRPSRCRRYGSTRTRRRA